MFNIFFLLSLNKQIPLGIWHWNCEKAVFSWVIPWIDRPLYWYGVLFALGFVVGYLVFCKQLKIFFKEKNPIDLGEIIDETVFLRAAQAAYEQEGEKTRPIQPTRTMEASKRERLHIDEINEKKSLLLELRQSHSGIMALKNKVGAIADSLILYVGVGAVAGARLFDIIFYQGMDVLKGNPWTLFQIWNGGLSSHGGVLGAIGGILIFRYRTNHRWSSLAKLPLLFDLSIVPIVIAGAFIRCGNFMNQEILGTLSLSPWAVIFSKPVDNMIGLPRHPVQLYEALGYLGLAILGVLLWKKRSIRTRHGLLSGLLLMLVFAFRCQMEVFKEEQSFWWHDRAVLKMGQILSLPLIALGFTLLWIACKKRGVTASEG